MVQVQTAPAPDGGRLAFAVMLAIVFINLIGFGIVVPLLPFYAHLYDAPPWEVTLLFSAYSMGQFLGELTWGRLSDRFGRKPVLLVTMVLTGVGYLGLAFAPNIWLAVAARAVSGFFGGNVSVIQGYIVDVSPPQRLVRRMGLFGLAFGGGFSLGPVFGGLLFVEGAGAAGFRPPLFLTVVLSWLSALAVLAFLREARADGGSAGPRIGPATALNEALRDPVMRRVLGATLLIFTGFSGMPAVLGLWGDVRFGWGAHEVGLVVTLTGLAAAGAQGLISATLVRRLGETLTIVAGALVCGLGIGAAIFGGPIWLVALVLMVATVGQAVTVPAVSTLISRWAPEDRRGATLGANNAAASVGRVIGPTVAGVLFGLAPDAPYVFCMAVAAPAAWLAWRAGSAARLRA